jgi:hypothetical protein
MSTGQKLVAPFPWFGGKSRVADAVWARFGDVRNYVEPFAGSLAVLLQRPTPSRQAGIETVNDIDKYLANFWRAVAADPEGVAMAEKRQVSLRGNTYGIAAVRAGERIELRGSPYKGPMTPEQLANEATWADDNSPCSQPE